MLSETNLEVVNKSTEDEDIFEITAFFDSDSSKSSGVLKKAFIKNKNRYGIANIASMTYYVHQDVQIDDLVSELDKHTKLLAVGMVDDNDDVVGIIIRREIFNLLARSYGDDFSKNRTVSSIAINAKQFHYSTNVFSIAEIIDEDLMSAFMQYYLLVDSSNQFCGIFSTRDLLVYLAKMSKRDLDTATKLQSRIVHDKFYKQDKFIEITAAAIMAKGVGGDFYSVNKMGVSHWFINIADVSGKGIGASFLTAIIGALSHTFDFKKGTKKFIQKLNEYIFETFESERFLTGLFTIFNEENGSLRLWDMGHSFIYIFRNNKIHNIKTDDGNIPIGICDHVEPESRKIQLLPDDMIIMTTDGIIEQMNDQRELYGMDRFSDLIRENINLNLDEIREIILSDLEEFRGIEPQHDDTTFIIFKYTPKENASNPEE